MVDASHLYPVRMTWTGNTGSGTAHYKGYERTHEYSVSGKPVIPGSSDPAFRGDATRYNPEELLVMSLSSCHMLWYLHLCAEAGVIVTDYVDDAVGTLVEVKETGGPNLENGTCSRFTVYVKGEQVPFHSHLSSYTPYFSGSQSSPSSVGGAM